MGVGTTFPDSCQILAGIDPDQRGAGTVTTGWVQISTSWSMTALIAVGEIASTATFDCKLQQASDGSGTGAKDLVTAAQLDDTGDNQVIVLTATTAKMDSANGFNFARLSCTVATANVDYGAVLCNYYTSYPAISNLDASIVAENS